MSVAPIPLSYGGGLLPAEPLREIVRRDARTWHNLYSPREGFDDNPKAGITYLANYTGIPHSAIDDLLTAKWETVTLDTADRYLCATGRHLREVWPWLYTDEQIAADIANREKIETDNREVWLDAKRCPGCALEDYFLIRSESASGRTLMLECPRCARPLRIVNQRGNRTNRRPDIDNAKIAAEYREGITLADLSEHYGAAVSSLRERLIKHGVEMRPRSNPRAAKLGGQTTALRHRRRRYEALPEITRLNAEGSTLAAISRAVGLSQKTVGLIIREQANA